MKKKSQDNYLSRGVGSYVHDVIKNLHGGIFPHSFCKILQDYLCGNPRYCNIIHSDVPGTKTSLAYAYWRETGDLSVWKGIAQDAMIVNIDDLLCVGITNEPILCSIVIQRNKFLISDMVITTIIDSIREFIDKMNSIGMYISLGEGDSSDTGDLVRTITLNVSMTVRAKRANIIVPNIHKGDVIVGLSSTGKASYEEKENSGMGSNGLSSAKHDIFYGNVGIKYPETYDHAIPGELVYCGSHGLRDPSPVKGMDWGKFVLSPSRTYAPIIISLLRSEMIKRSDIHGVINCTECGQTRVLNFLGDHVKVIKDSLFPIPELFVQIQKSSNTGWREMFEDFNMGHRMEIYCAPELAPVIISIAKEFNVEGRIIGYCQRRSTKTRLSIVSQKGEFHYY